MNRRKFAQSLLTAMGISYIPQTVLANATEISFKKGQQLSTNDGLRLSLKDCRYPVNNHDQLQFILDFKVENKGIELTERIYHLKDQNGRTHQVYMIPVSQGRLQAVYNWRTHA